MDQPVVIGVDIGTTSTKVVVCDAEGHILATAERAATQLVARPGFAEMDPNEWWSNLCVLMPEVLGRAGAGASQVAAIAVSGMVPTLVAVDANNDVLHPSIQQNDARASTEIAMSAQALPDALTSTGSAVSAQSIGPKWLWMRRWRPDVVDSADAILGSYGWIIAKMTGRRVADENWALESGLAAITGGWLPELCRHYALDERLLPEICPSGEAIGTLQTDAAAELGLARGTPITAGCADHVVSAFSAGLLEPGQVLVKLGGAGDILVVTREPVVDERVFLDRHPVFGRWMPNGCMASSGTLLRWFQTVTGGVELSLLDAEAGAVGAGSGGLIALPHFLGEKTPINDPLARGAFVGLHLGHTRAHMFRALLEGVAFGFVHHLDVFAEMEIEVSEVRVTNGGSRSALWKQIIADAIGRPLLSITTHPGSSWGAALLAVGAVGLADPADLVRARSTIDEVFEPSPATGTMRHLYERYRHVQRVVSDISHEIAEENWT